MFLQRQIPFSTASSLLNQGRVCCARAVAGIVLGEGSPLKEGPGCSCPRLPLSRSHARPFLGDVTHGGDRGAAGQSTHGCTGQSPLLGGLPAANLIHFLPATSPRCDSSLSSNLRPLPAPTGLCVPSPHRPRPWCRVHSGVPGRVVVHSAVCMGTGRGASGRALRPRAFRVPDVSTPALCRCWQGAGGTSRPRPVQAAGHPGHCSNDFVPWPLLLPGRAPGDGPPRPTSVFTASSGTVGDRPLLQCRKPRVREVGSPRSHGQPGDMWVAVRGCGPGLLPSRPNLTGAWGPRGASKGRSTDPASGHAKHFFRPQTLFPFIFFKTAPNA